MAADMDYVWVQVDSDFRTNAGRNRIKWAGRRHELPRGQRVMIPTEAFNNWFGDPSIRDIAAGEGARPGRYRALEVERVGAKWGIGVGKPFQHAEELNQHDEDGEWVGYFPIVSAWTYEGDPINVLIMDPENQKYLDGLDDGETDVMSERAEQLRRQLSMTRQALIQAGEDPEGLDFDISTPQVSDLDVSAMPEVIDPSAPSPRKKAAGKATPKLPVEPHGALVAPADS